MAESALVYGLAVAGEATARALVQRGWQVVVADDRPSDDAGQRAAALGAELVVAPGEDDLRALVARTALVVPSPGVPEGHRLFAVAAAAAGVPVRTEIDLAYEWEQDRVGGPRPIVAVTGTDGKTTVTLLAAAMVEASGRRAVAAGNTEVPLVTAVDLDVDVLVVECTSFRLAAVDRFRPDAGTWLNLAPDHLDWHRSLDTYAAAKARIWEHQRSDDVAIGYGDDPVVMAYLGGAPGRQLTFGSQGDYRAEGGRLVGPSGPFAEVRSLHRQLPHDITNALAAAATVLEAGVASPDGVAAALSSFEGVPHRITLVGQVGGVSFYDDSKATTPHAAITAIRAFDKVVLVAGGKNKGLDLGTLAAEPGRMRAVVAIGTAATEVADAFAGICPVVAATSMDEAVTQGRRAAAESGDAVLLSPGCASFDWYAGYAERGDDFARAVRSLIDTESTGSARR